MSSLSGHQRLFPASIEERLVGGLGRSIGVAALVVIIALWLSLVSWSAVDPSLTHATERAATNWLGAPGALVADLLIETLGFALLAALLVPMFWALEFVAGERVENLATRAAFLPVAMVAIAGALSSLPVPDTWPLDHGLGGILGDVALSGVATLFGLVRPDRANAAAGVLLAGGGLYALGAGLAMTFADVRTLLALRWPRLPTSDRRAASALIDRWRVQQWKTGFDVAHLFAGARSVGGDDADRPASEPYFGAAPDHAPTLTRWGGDPANALSAEPRDEDHRRTEPSFEPPPAMHSIDSGTHASFEDDSSVEADDADAFDRLEDTLDDALDASSRAMALRFAPAGVRAPERANSTAAIAAQFAPANAHTRATTVAHVPVPAAVASARPAPQASASPAPAPRSLAAKIAATMPFKKSTGGYHGPSPALLKRPATGKVSSEVTQTVLRGSARLLEDVLVDFGVKGEIRDIRPGPVVTLFEFEPARGTKSSRVIALADDIARQMGATSVRIAVVPGRNAIGIELPNARRDAVALREILEQDAFRAAPAALPLALGKSIAGEPVVADLAMMPHLLVAGTTGSGKSVGVNAMIVSLLMRHGPETCRFLMIDPKMLELSVYNGIPHLLAPVVTEPAKAVAALNWAANEMEERYKRMAQIGVRSVEAFNARIAAARQRGEAVARTVQTGFDARTGKPVYERETVDLAPLPYIVVVVDEFADLMITAGKDVEAAVQRLAQKARAAGIHLIMATQRPSVDVVTGTIKANFPARISFKVASKVDSRTILNEQGAEQLLGQGDMLWTAGSGQLVRVHGAYVGDEEVEAVATHLRALGAPDYAVDLDAAAGRGDDAREPASQTAGDDLYDRAVAIVLRDGKASTSYLQRRLGIGYNRAADLVERLEREGVVGPADHAGRRAILVSGAGAA